VIRHTPFHPRLSQLNGSGLYTHWQGYLSPLRYGDSAKHEYFAIRNSAGFFDGSPLYKYIMQGVEAEKFLAGVLIRDIGQCPTGHAQYTAWCNDSGEVLEDGVVFRLAPTEFLLTTARPNFGYFSSLSAGYQVSLEDVSDHYGVLAVQGPRSREVVTTLALEAGHLPYFGHAEVTIANTQVRLSRTGFTGDLGYELHIPAEHCLEVLDAVMGAGDGLGLRPFGEEALLMARIEAGLPLIGVEFTPAHLAEVPEDRLSPHELGFGWMLRDVTTTTRAFIGRDAIRKELADNTTRWRTVGIRIDPVAYHDLYFKAGLVTRLNEAPVSIDYLLYDDQGDQVGYTTSLMYSPLLQQHVGIARVHPAHAAIGQRVHVEQTVHHRYTSVAAQITGLPHFNPTRKTS
jgi:aminomethyltransferase